MSVSSVPTAGSEIDSMFWESYGRRREGRMNVYRDGEGGPPRSHFSFGLPSINGGQPASYHGGHHSAPSVAGASVAGSSVTSQDLTGFGPIFRQERILSALGVEDFREMHTIQQPRDADNMEIETDFAYIPDDHSTQDLAGFTIHESYPTGVDLSNRLSQPRPMRRPFFPPHRLYGARAGLASPTEWRDERAWWRSERHDDKVWWDSDAHRYPKSMPALSTTGSSLLSESCRSVRSLDGLTRKRRNSSPYSIHTLSWVEEYSTAATTNTFPLSSLQRTSSDSSENSSKRKRENLGEGDPSEKTGPASDPVHSFIFAPGPTVSPRSNDCWSDRPSSRARTI